MNRAAFDQTLSEIQADVVRMGGLAHDMVELAVQSALNDDKSLSKEVFRLEKELDAAEQLCTTKIVETSVLGAPVAKDLLFLTSTLAILGEIERTGDDAWKLARRSLKLKVPFPDDLKELLVSTDRAARTNLVAALALYTQFSREAADTLISNDRLVDDGYKASRRALLDKMVEDPDQKRQHFRISEIFHALEHVSDHAVNIAKTLKLFYERATPPAG